MTTNPRRPSDIEAELADNREHIEATLDALQHRLSGESIVERSCGYWRATRADEFAANLGRSARRNPAPLALLGVGLGWLVLAGSEPVGRMVEQKTPDANRDQSEGNSENSGSSVKQAVADMRQRAQSAAHGAENQAGRGRQRFNRAADQTRRGAARATETARDRASRAGRATRQGTARALDSANNLYQEQPLVTATLGLALGAVCAASLPRSTSEDRAFGSTRDDFVASARETGQTKAGQAQSVAESAADAATDAAKSEAERQGIRDPGQ